MFRKRRQPTPFFRMPPPYQPITGERETLRAKGKHPYCAMFQVAAADIYDNFVICRGYDTRTKRYYNYEAGDANKPGIAVAKPYGKRHKGLYQIGEIYQAVLPLWMLTANTEISMGVSASQNPGSVIQIGDVNFGQPLNLTLKTQAVNERDHKWINWMLIDSSPVLRWMRLYSDLFTCGSQRADTLVLDSSGEFCDINVSTTVTDSFGVVAGSQLAVGTGAYRRIQAGNTVLAMRVSDPDIVGDESDTYISQWAAITFGKGCCDVL